MSVHSSPAASAEPRRGVWRVVVNVLTALAVLLIGASATALSYLGIYEQVLNAEVIPEDYPWLAHLYPGLITLLLLLTLLSSYVLARARWPYRLAVNTLFVLLIAVAAVAVAAESLEDQRGEALRLDEPVNTIVFAAAPWVAVLIGFVLARWVDIELRGARREPSEPQPEPVKTAPEEPQQAPAHLGDIEWLNGRLQPEGAQPPDHAPAASPEVPDAVEPKPAETPAAASADATEQTVPLAPAEPTDVPEPEPADTAEPSSGTAAEPREDSDTEPTPGPAAAADPTPPPAASPPLESKPEPDSQPTVPLPKRTPGRSHQPERMAPAATPLPAPEPAQRDEDEPAHTDIVEDGFVPEAPQDDPTSDEAYPEHAGAAEDHVAPVATATTVDLPKRPMVRRPRRSDAAEFPPPDPPSGRVRSGPIPPKK